MNEIYWITRLGALNDFLLACCSVFGVLVFSAGIFYVTENLDKYCPDEEAIKKSKKWLIKGIIFFFISLLGVMFTPSKKECLVIYGLGGTIDYVKSNDKAKKLPDKVIDALDMYLEDQTKEK